MALELKANLETDSTSLYLWSIDKTGLYDPIDNPGGHGDGGDGSGNSNLNEVAMMVIGKVMNEDPLYHEFVGSQVKQNAGYTNDTELEWQLNYLQDGYHNVYLIKLWASTNDVNSIDSYNARTFIVGDMWFNITEQVIKLKESGGDRTLDLEVDADLETIIANENNIQTLCKSMFYVNLFGQKEEYSRLKRTARREEDYTQEDEMRKNEMDIITRVASADWNYGGANFFEAHDLVESLIDDHLG